MYSVLWIFAVAVQAMALKHGSGDIEIACNLLDTSVSSPEAVLDLLAQLLVADGGTISSSYRIGKSVAELVSVCLDPPGSLE